ncbi:hypothetical protein GCM10009016_07450 [Halomonas beimenensis]
MDRLVQGQQSMKRIVLGMAQRRQQASTQVVMADDEDIPGHGGFLPGVVQWTQDGERQSQLSRVSMALSGPDVLIPIKSPPIGAVPLGPGAPAETGNATRPVSA